MKTSATIYLGAGGMGQIMAHNLSAIGATMGILFENAEELGATTFDPRVITVPLARDETVKSIVERHKDEPLYAELCKRIAKRQGDLSIGLAQVKGLGLMALDEVMVLETIFGRIWNHIVEQSDAHPRRIVILAVSSGSGGTGAGTLREALDRFTRYISGRSNAIVSVYLYRFGPYSFNGCGNNVLNNGAFTHVEDLNWVLSDPTGAKIVPHLIAVNSPIKDGKERELRTEHVTLITSAMLAPETRTQFGMGELNEEVVGATGISDTAANMDPGGFGRIKKMQPTIRKLRRVNLRASASMFLVPAVRDLVRVPESLVEIPVKPTITIKRKTPPKTKELASLAATKGALMPTWWTSWVQGEYNVTTNVTFLIPGSDALFTTTSLRALTMPRTLDEYQERRVWLTSLINAVTAEMRKIEIPNQAVVKGMMLKKSEIEEKVGILFPKSLIEKGKAAVNDRQKTLQQAVVAITQYAQLEEMATKNKNLLEMLGALKKAAETAIEQLNKTIENAVQMLESISKEDGAVVGIFTTVDLSVVFGDLMMAVASGNKERLDKCLVSAIKGMSQKGIALTAGLEEDASVEAITTALMQPGDIHGSDVTDLDEYLPDETLVVFPPMSEDLKIEFQVAFGNTEKKWGIVCTNAVTDYVGIVTLRKTMCNSLETIMSKDLVAVVEQTPPPDDILFRVPGYAGWKELNEIVREMNGGTKEEHKEGAA